MASYKGYRGIRRVRELRAKASRTPEEEKLLQDLIQDPDIQPYI